MVARLIHWFKSLFEHPQPLLIEKLLTTLAHGDEVELEAVIYGYESLSDAERRVPLGLLKKLHSPSFEQDLVVVEKHSLDRFSLLIVRVPWLSDPEEVLSGHEPLLIAKQGKELRVLGYVLPWNEIIEQFSRDEMAIITKLSMVWISKTIQAQKTGDA
jgi:hypothetical protein